MHGENCIRYPLSFVVACIIAVRMYLSNNPETLASLSAGFRRILAMTARGMVGQGWWNSHTKSGHGTYLSVCLIAIGIV